MEAKMDTAIKTVQERMAAMMKAGQEEMKAVIRSCRLGH
jgi:hypothetical protein